MRPTRHVPSGDVAHREPVKALSEDVKSSSRSMVTLRNNPFSENTFRRRITDQPTSIVLPRTGSGERTPEKLGSNDVPGANECVSRGTSITAEIGECVARHSAQEDIHTRSYLVGACSRARLWREKTHSRLGVEVDASETRGIE